MSSLALLSFVLATPPAPAARVVSGPPRLVAGTQLAAGAPLAAGALVQTRNGERAELLTAGRCLLTLGPRTRLRLAPPAPGTRCPQVRLAAGRLALAAPRGATPALRIHLPTGSVTLEHGVATARASGGLPGLCLATGRARAEGPRGAAPRGAAAPPTPAPTPAPTPTPALAPTPTPAPAQAEAGQCLWLGPAGAATSRYAPEAARSHRALARPLYTFTAGERAPLPDLAAELERLKDRRAGGEKGGAEVEGSGQSMCLETGGSGGVGDLGTGGTVEIARPPPPARLRLRVVLGRSGR